MTFFPSRMLYILFDVTRCEFNKLFDLFSWAYFGNRNDEHAKHTHTWHNALSIAFGRENETNDEHSGFFYEGAYR